MSLVSALEMLLLAALWGGSFLFLRIAVPEFGPVALAGVRVGGAALLLLPLAAWRGELPRMRPFIPTLIVSALLSTVLPFMGMSQAARTLPAGLMSILNATTPMWGALVGWLWIGDRPTVVRLLGLGTGLVGVALLATDRSQINTPAAWQAVALCLAATLTYAVAIHHAKRYFSDLAPVSVSAGSVTAGTLMLALPTWWIGPSPAVGPPLGWSEVSPQAWGAVLGLAVLCTGLAYLLFYRLIGRIGPTRAMTVTFMIPVFGMLWGSLFLGEDITPAMMASTAVIVAGTWLSNGTRPSFLPAWLSRREPRPPQDFKT